MGSYKASNMDLEWYIVLQSVLYTFLGSEVISVWQTFSFVKLIYMEGLSPFDPELNPVPFDQNLQVVLYITPYIFLAIKKLKKQLK